jgi:alkanesulfonate monooxygenase SsuD/methylene tetrahydromethanopterin reductase-like flavin-dependent oxidoreductase (luciferase family)
LIRIGVNLPTFDPLGIGGPPSFVEVAKQAEQAGIDGVWVGDHLRMPAPGYDSTLALAAVAACTDRVTLGFAVMLLGLRHPAWAAKQLTTLDALAPGRVLLGVGVGGEFPEEFEALGLSAKQRGQLLDRALAELPSWLDGTSAPPLAPTIGKLPPIYVGGRGEPALQRAARVGDWWLPIWLTPDKLRERMVQLGELAEQEGRPTPRLALALSVHVDADEGLARQRASECTKGMYGVDFERFERYTPFGSVERVASQIAAYVDAGVEEFVLTPLTGDPLPQIERLAAVREIISGQ